MEEISLEYWVSKFVHNFISTLIRISGDLIPETIINVLSYRLKGHRLIGGDKNHQHTIGSGLRLFLCSRRRIVQVRELQKRYKR